MSDTKRQKASDEQMAILLENLRAVDPHLHRWWRFVNPNAPRAIQEDHLETRIFYCNLGDMTLEFRRRYTRWRQSSRVKMDIIIHIDGKSYTVTNKNATKDYRERIRNFIDIRIEPVLTKYLKEGEYFEMVGDYVDDLNNFLNDNKQLVTLKGNSAEIKQQLGGLFVTAKPKSTTRHVWNT